jgi:hypothetical protein
MIVMCHPLSDGVCFNVAADGQSISGAGSSCVSGAAAWTNLDGLSEDTGDCLVEISCEGAWPIDDGSFACINSSGDLIIGEFGNPTMLPALRIKREVESMTIASLPGLLHLTDLTLR